MVIVVMGVAGSGKTTVGRRLAGALSWSFRDADSFHSRENIAKMSAGLALDDRDRAPWLGAIRTHIASCLTRGENAVVTCSALKESYRRTLAVDPRRVSWVHLAGPFELIRRRLAGRRGHFMKEGMLRSQFSALEAPRGALVLDAAEAPSVLVAKIRAAFKV